MKKLFSLFIAATLIFCIFSTVSYAGSEKFESLSFPEEAISPFTDDLFKTVSSGDDYISNCGHNRTGTFISPYWLCSVNGKAVDVYASLTYDEEIGGGVLHSYSCIWIESGAKPEITLESLENPGNAVILPQKDYSDFRISGNRISFSVNNFGSFTCLINDDDMRFAFTLFVREYTDEEAEIEALKKEYGESRVAVYEKRYYETDVMIADDYDAVYFRRGSYFCAKHIYDLRSDEEAAAIPQTREFILLYGRNNIKIKGYGTLDFTKLDRKERSPMFVSNCTECSVEGLCFLNSGGWTLTAYACENLDISDITQFSYRTNSDGINICGCNNVNVSDSFIRNGDDSFSVKTTNIHYEAHDIAFDNCIGWSTKARCFGITGEVERDIYNIIFRNSYVFNRNATWDNDRVSSLAISVECGKGQISNVLFENIDIRSDKGRAFNCIIYGKDVENCNIKDIKLKNIRFTCGEKPKISTRLNATFLQKICFVLNRILKIFGIESNKITAYCGGNHIDILFENIIAGGTGLTQKNHSRFIETEGFADIVFC